MRQSYFLLSQALRRANEDPKNDTSFAEVINRAMDSGVANEASLASLLCVGRSTIKRWKDGLSCPHTLGRPSVYDAIEKLMHEKVDDILSGTKERSDMITGM